MPSPKTSYWKQWYTKNRSKLLKEYRRRYKNRIETETPAERKKRLAKQRKIQQAYEKRKKAKLVSDHGN